MRKLVAKFKGSRGGGKVSKKEIVHDDDHDDEESHKQVIESPRPAPAPHPVYDPQYNNPVSPVEPHDDVGTFSGFDSWLSSFTPDPHSTNVAEMPVQPVHSQVLTLEGFPPGDYMNLSLGGLRKPSHAHKFNVTIRGPWYITLKQLLKLLKDNNYEEPVSAKHAGLALPDWNPDHAMPKDFQILAADGPSCYDMDAESGLLINKDEPIGHFTENLRRLIIRCKDDKVVATSFPAELEISFNRTLRLPEDGRLHNQPSGVSRIPVMNIAGISKKLLSSGNASLMDMARKGGVFFPLYQREAMFLSFKATNDNFAVRPFVGGVNAVSGLPWNTPPHHRPSKQDYVSVPPQEYLDGIAVGQETVKQFIAMPLGSGYSVEKQVTGKEDVGGMQLEIIPGNHWHVSARGVEQFSPHETARRLDVSSVVLSWVITDWPSQAPKTRLPSKSLVKLAKWIQEHRPVYMRHLYYSQINEYSQTGYGYQQHSVPSRSVPWRPGADVYMTAVYRLNLTLAYEEDGNHRTMHVEWPPWWTLQACILERSQAGAKIMGHDLDGERFILYYQGKGLGASTLQEQGVEDNSIIQVTLRHPPQSTYSGGYYGSAYHSEPVQMPSPPQELNQAYLTNSAPHYSQHPGKYYEPLPLSDAPRPSIMSELAHTAANIKDSAASAVFPWKKRRSAQPPSSGAMGGPQMSSPPMSTPQQQMSAPQRMSSPPPMSARPPQMSASHQMAPPPMMPMPATNPYSSPPRFDAAPPPMASPPNAPRPMMPSSILQQEAYAPSSPSVSSPGRTYSNSPMPDTPTSYGSTPMHSPPPAQSHARPIDQTGWAMGIAAGSRIRQLINKDPFSAAAWCKGRATILSIQILNSVAFERLTGMLAPPSPITPQMYKHQGLPFFASYGEGADVDGGHNLAGVRSVGEVDAAGGNIQLGASLNSSSKVGCTSCAVMLCDSILRPCNHTFCTPCITHYMTYGDSLFCRICQTRATNLIGFSAPMALPGEDRVDFSSTKVITTEPYGGDLGFQSIYELDGGTYVPLQQETLQQPTAYELPV